MDKKRIIALIIFSLIVIVVGWLLWRTFFAPEKTGVPRVPRPDVTDPGSAFPGAGDAGDRTPVDSGTGVLPIVPGGPSLPTAERERTVTDSRVRAVALSASGALRYYNEQDGKFYTVDANGNAVALSDQVFFQADSVEWSPVDNQAIIEYPDGSNIYYNFDTQKQVTLPQHWEDFSFSPQADKIAAKSMTLSPENRYLITSNPDGQQVRLVEPMGLNADKVEVDWSPNKQVLAFSKTGNPLGANRQEILLVGQYGENFKSIVVEGRGYDSIWSDDGSKVVYDVYSQRNSYKPELWVVDASGDQVGGNRRMLSVETWAEKCAFQDSRFVYCGVPTSLQTGAGFAPQTAFNTLDRIVRIDTQTGLETELSVDGDYIVESMVVSEDGTRLYITDRRTSLLTEISL